MKNTLDQNIISHADKYWQSKKTSQQRGVAAIFVALRVVKSETNDFLVPAHAEMVIEGEITLDDLEREGPYGEGLGYQGDGEMAWWMNVTTVTHRRNPWMHNSFTGVDPGPMKSHGIA